MMSNANQRLNIWLKLNNRFDYAEFTQACRAEGVEPQSIMEFAQKAGMLTVAITAHPSLPPGDAYLQLIHDASQPVSQAPVEPPPDAPATSRGFGDTVAKFTHATGLDKLAEAYTSITGKPCGCSSRQEALNKLLPYAQE